MTDETAIATQEPKAISTFAADLAADAAQFKNDFGKDDLAIPFLRVLQSNSPQCQEGGPDFIEGAKAGKFINTTNKDIYDGVKDGVVLVPVAYEKTVIEWKTREVGGGFVKNHGLIEGMDLLKTTHKDDKNRDILPNGNQLVTTAQYVVLIDRGPENEPIPAFFALVSTQLKKSRGWNSTIDGIRAEVNGRKVKPPMFYMSYLVKTVFETNDKGSYYGVQISPNAKLEDLENGEELYAMAKALRSSVDTGKVNVEASANAETTASSEEIPF